MTFGWARVILMQVKAKEKGIATMGVYLYGIKKSNPVKAVFDNKLIRVYRLQYITKPRWSVFEEELGALAKRIVGRIQSAWGDELPEYVAIIDKNEQGKENFVGATVYRNPPSVLWYDSDKIADEVVGYLFRATKGNIVVPVADMTELVRDVTGLSNIDALMNAKTLEVDYSHPRSNLVVDLYLRNSFRSAKDIVAAGKVAFVA